MSQAQPKKPNIDNRNRYYNEGRNEGEEEEEEDVNMYAQSYQDQQENDNQSNQLNKEFLTKQMLQMMKQQQQLQDPNQMNQMMHHDEDYQDEMVQQFQQYNGMIPDQEGGIEKQWFYSFQENSDDNENIQQISYIPSSQYQSQQHSISGSQQKIPSYINQPQQMIKQINQLPFSQSAQLSQSQQQLQFQQQHQQRLMHQQQQQQYNKFNGSAGMGEQDEEGEENDPIDNEELHNQSDSEQMHMMMLMQGNQQQFDNMEIANQQLQNNQIEGHEIEELSQQVDDSQEQQLQQQQQQEQLQPEEMIMCNKCLQFPINYIELNCSHSFCLQCMANWFGEQGYLTLDQVFEIPLSSTDENYSELKEEMTLNVDCMLCKIATLLDYDSVEAVKEVMRQIQINLFQQQENDKILEQIMLKNEQFQQQQEQQLEQDENEEGEQGDEDNIQNNLHPQQFKNLEQQANENQQFYYEKQQHNSKNQQNLMQPQQIQRNQQQINEVHDEDTEELIEDGDLNYQNLQQSQTNPYKINPIKSVNNFASNNQSQNVDSVTQSLTQSTSGFPATQQPQVSNLNLQKLQPNTASSSSPVLIIQNDSQINSLQARQEIIYEDSSETFQTEETNRNHNGNNTNNNNSNNNNSSSFQVSNQTNPKQLDQLQPNQIQSLQQPQKQQQQNNEQQMVITESKSSSSQQNYSNQENPSEGKIGYGKDGTKFINTSNKNYHHVNSQQSFSNNNSSHNNTTPYDTNSMQLFSRKNQDYTSFSNSQFNASMTPQSNSEVNFNTKEQQIIHNHAMPFNDFFSMNEKHSHLISPKTLQQQQLIMQQNQQADLTHSNYSGASTSNMHEGSTMSDLQKKMMLKTTNDSFKSVPDNSKKIATKSSTPNQLSSEKYADGQYQLEDVQEHYGEQTDDETDGLQYHNKQLNFSKKSPNVQMSQSQQQQQIGQIVDKSEIEHKELNYDDFANVSDSNLQEEDSSQLQQQLQNNYEFSQNSQLRDSQKQNTDQGNRIPRQQQQDIQMKNIKGNEKQQQQILQFEQQQQNMIQNNVGNTNLNQFAQQIQKLSQKDQNKLQQINNQNFNVSPPSNFDSKFISKDLKMQQLQQQQLPEEEDLIEEQNQVEFISNQELQDYREEHQEDGEDDEDQEHIDYDLRVDENENEDDLDEQQMFSNQLYQQIKSEQKYNLEQKIQKLNVEQMQKQQQQQSQQFSKQQQPHAKVSEEMYDTIAGNSTNIGDQSNMVSNQKITDKNVNSVRPLNNVNIYEPIDESNRKKQNNQKFVMANNNSNNLQPSNFSTNNNFISNNSNNNNNNVVSQHFDHQSNSQTNQFSQSIQNQPENSKFRMPQNTHNQQQSFNSSMNEDRMNPASSVLTGERSIDYNLVKQDRFSKRNSQSQANNEEEQQQSGQIQNRQTSKSAQIQPQNDAQTLSRKTSDNRLSQNESETNQQKKRNSQALTNQQNLDLSNSVNEQLQSQSEIANKSRVKQDLHQSYDSQVSQGYSKYDLPMKMQQHQNQGFKESEGVVISKSSNTTKRDTSPQITSQKGNQQNIQQVQNQTQVQSSQQQEESLKRSNRNADTRYNKQKQDDNVIIEDQIDENQVNYNQQQQYEEEIENIDFKFQPYCDEHPYEELGFFNFSQNKCICLKCLQKGDFITEDVTNFEKGQELLLEKVDDCSRQINVCIELIKLSTKRQEEKHRKRVEKTNQAKIMINEQFQLILQKIEEKQAQLLGEADEIERTSERILSDKIDQLQHKVKILAQLRHHFSEINQSNIQPNAKTFKEFQFCRNILDQFLYENEDILQLANHSTLNASPNSSASKNVANNYNYMMNNQQQLLQQSQQEIINNFNMDEISLFIEQIQFLKNKVTDLRGIELGTHNSSLRNSFSNNMNKNQQQFINGSNMNLNNTSNKFLNQNMNNNPTPQVQSFMNEDMINNQQSYKEPKPYYKSSDKSSRRLSSSQKQQMQQQNIQQSQQQFQQQLNQASQEQQNVHFSPIDRYPQISDSYQMNPPNAFETEDQTINLNQLFQQQQQFQQKQQMQAQMANQMSVNSLKKQINDKIQYVMGQNPFEKEKQRDTNSTFSSQNLTCINNNNSLNQANILSQKMNISNVNSPAGQQQQLQQGFNNSPSLSFQNIIKSQSQKNLYEQQQQQQLSQQQNNFLSQDQQNNYNNPFGATGFNNQNYSTLTRANEYQERLQQKTDPGNIATHNNNYKQFQNNKLQQQHLLQFNQILNAHLGSGASTSTNQNAQAMNNSHAMSLLEGGVSHHLGSTAEASRNIQLIDDQFANFKSNLADEFNNSIESNTLKRPSQPSTSASKSGQQVIDLFRKTNSVANILSTNSHQSPNRYSLLKGSGSNTKINSSTINSNVPKSNEYYNRSSFVSNYYNPKLEKGGFSTTGSNSNNTSSTNIKVGNHHATFSHRLPNSDALSTIPLSAQHNTLLSKKRQSQIMKYHYNSNQNNSQSNLNNYSSELKNSFCETGSINNSGNRYNTKKSEISYISGASNPNIFQVGHHQQVFNAPHNTSFSKSKQASHGNLNSFYNNNNTSMNITNANMATNNIVLNNNNNNNNNNINTLASDFNHNISFQGTTGKTYNIKNQNTLDSKNSGFIYKSLKKYQDLFRRQKKIMFENENN